MKEIELFINEEGEWCDRISLVENPAIMSDFMAFAAVKQNFTTDHERHIITGAVMVPDMRIYRNDEHGEYMVYFSAETIEKIAHKWIREDMSAAFNLDHTTDTRKVNVIESWLKSDMSADKSVALGLPGDLPVGTWFISAKVDDESIWQQIKAGAFNGFSIQGIFHTEQPQEDISDEEFLQAIQDELMKHRQ